MRFCKDCSNYKPEYSNDFTGRYEHEECIIPTVTSGPDPVTGEPMRHLRPRDPREKNADFSCSDFVQLSFTANIHKSATLWEKIASLINAYL